MDSGSAPDSIKSPACEQALKLIQETEVAVGMLDRRWRQSTEIEVAPLRMKSPRRRSQQNSVDPCLAAIEAIGQFMPA